MLFIHERAVISMTALPFNTTQQVVSFLEFAETYKHELRGKLTRYCSRIDAVCLPEEEHRANKETMTEPKTKEKAVSSRNSPRRPNEPKHEGATTGIVSAKHDSGKQLPERLVRFCCYFKRHR